MEDRNTQVRKMESDVKDLSAVFSDFLTIYDQQREGIEMIDSNIAGTRNQVEDGNLELLKVESRQSRSTCRKCLLLLLALTFLAVLILGWHYEVFG
mmetsp:Transcript_9196/g.13800  ORF Transcript_9196/g.13800 Transcript_9196/m.13800 type:complete len:96 (-) Transcript_9196:237-524(-)